MIALTLLAFVMAEPPTVKGFVPPNAGPVVKGFVAAPEVAAPVRTFRNGSFHGSHNCPVCGLEQLSIASGNKRGPHSHRCSDANCATWWRH